MFIAPNASIIGNVKIGKQSSIWFGSTLRGDVHSIEIGEYSNIQDHCMLHVTGGKFSLTMGDNCTLGHNVTLHGCTLDDYAFIGIGATILDGCHIGKYALVGAGSLVTPGKTIPPGMLAIGAPAKVARAITPEEKEMIINIPEKYSNLKKEYLDVQSFSQI